MWQFKRKCVECAIHLGKSKILGLIYHAIKKILIIHKVETNGFAQVIS